LPAGISGQQIPHFGDLENFSMASIDPKSGKAAGSLSIVHSKSNKRRLKCAFLVQCTMKWAAYMRFLWLGFRFLILFRSGKFI